MGSVTDFDLTALYDDSKSLAEECPHGPGYSMDGWYGRIFSGSGFFDMDKPIRRFTKKELRPPLRGADEDQGRGHQPHLRGPDPEDPEVDTLEGPGGDAAARRAFVERAITFTTCPDCDGTRLSEEARSAKIGGKNIADLCAMQISDLADWVRDLAEPSVTPLLTGLQHLHRLLRRDRVGLSLARPAGRHPLGW